jgi:hypothetical protein
MPRSGKSEKSSEMTFRKSIIVFVTLLSIFLIMKFMLTHVWNLTYIDDPFEGRVP